MILLSKIDVNNLKYKVVHENIKSTCVINLFKIIFSLSSPKPYQSQLIKILTSIEFKQGQFLKFDNVLESIIPWEITEEYLNVFLCYFYLFTPKEHNTYLNQFNSIVKQGLLNPLTLKEDFFHILINRDENYYKCLDFDIFN